MALWFATGNEHKRQELEAILGRRLKIPSDAGIGFDPDENGGSFLENALIKARALYAIVREPVIADDSGLCVDALGGRPGVYSARYGSADGRKLSDAERNRLLLAELDAASGNGGHSGGQEAQEQENRPFQDNCGDENSKDSFRNSPGSAPRRTARFVCAMALLVSEDRFFAAQETLEGEITAAGRGAGGFGYDPILYIPGLGRTVAELSEAEKNRLSHRGKAGKAVARYLDMASAEAGCNVSDRGAPLKTQRNGIKTGR